jgi:hypothetical protein
MLKAIRYRVQNFRNIDDSGWIPLERVTAFVGRPLWIGVMGVANLGSKKL